MSGRLYALLVGINDYPAPVGKLRGCLNDLDQVREWLTDSYGGERLAIECLSDSEATRANLIRLFRGHLGQAGPDDVVLFHYSGHGARSRSAPAFARYYPDGFDEGLVCVDSRQPGGFDLADKELAVLLAEVAARGPHTAMLLDCCHSGSATRGADDFTQARARFTQGVDEPRPLESYLDGWYAARFGRGEPLELPASRHILLAACERVQKAWESRDHRGVFTSTLLDVLRERGAGIDYADLFLRARSAVKRYADDQTPQFETYAGFDAYAGFLGAVAARRPGRFSVAFEQGRWTLNRGALHGLPTDPQRPVELALYRPAAPESLVGHARTIQIGAQESEVELRDLAADPAQRFEASITSLPVVPLGIALTGETGAMEAARAALREAEDAEALGFAFSDQAGAAEAYRLECGGGRFRLVETRTGRLIQGSEGDSAATAALLIPAMKTVADWERAAARQNRSTRMDTAAVDFRFVERLADGSEHVHQGADLTLDITPEGRGWRAVIAGLRANNRSAQPLHFALAYLSNDFRIQVPYNERIEPTEALFDLIVGDAPTFTIRLDDNEGDEAEHLFQLIVTTERIDDFLLVQHGLDIGSILEPRRDLERGIEFGAPRKKLIHQNEWFTKSIRVRLVRRLDQVGERDLELAGGAIRIKGHPSLRAGVSLTTAADGTRGLPGADASAGDFSRALERQGLELVRFAATRGPSTSVLELTDIENPDSLAAEPLEITLDLGLGPDEAVLPLAFDGEDILLAGEPERDPEGRTRAYIDRIPDGIPDHRRGLGKALKLYFFKTYLKRKDVDRLCWVEYLPDGSAVRHATDLAARVAGAHRILLLVHGIIGDTQNMAEGVRLAVDAAGQGVDRRFDLVLTYDYENLGGTIEGMAATLKSRLAEVKIQAGDDKHLTLLVHSMGGLIARWLIERGDGNQFIDHLVMCGTPNQGSPFGKIDAARGLMGLLTGWAINAFPAFAPFGAGLLTLLGRSKKISPTLEQMDPDSPFIQTLGVNPDPRVRYSILAGDIRGYEESADPLMARLTAKLGKGPLFDRLYHDAGHDIAVATASIEAVPPGRAPEPVRRVVPCHHLNYFISDAGLRALASVDW